MIKIDPNIKAPTISTSNVPADNPVGYSIFMPKSTADSKQNISNAKSIPTTLQEAKDIILKNVTDLDLSKEELDYIMKATCVQENFGTARYDSQKDKITVNTNPDADADGNCSAISKEEMIKILIHEVTHASKKSAVISQEEERKCEVRSIKQTAKLVNKGVLKPFDVYNADIRILAINDKLLNSKLDDWLKGGYKNRIESVASARTTIYLQDREMPNSELDKSPKVVIQKGDKIIVEGREYPIGQFFVEGQYRTNVCQLFDVQNNEPKTSGILIFDGSEQSDFAKELLKRRTANFPEKPFQLLKGGEIIASGKFY